MVEEAAISMGINLASTAVCAATALGRGKAEQLVRERSIDRDLDDLNTEFGEALEEAIEDSNAGSDVGELAGVADNWDAVAREVHGLSTESTGETGGASQARERLAFASEEEVIDTLAEEIASVQGYDLSETGGLERELKQALSVAYQRSLDSFIDRIAGTERADKLVVESQLEQLDELRTVLKRLAELEAKFSTPQHYDLTDVEAEGLDAAAEGLALTGPDLEFVDRPELADHYDGHRRLLVGRGGSGKSRALAELVENYEREVARVVRPREAFNDAEDFRRLRNEGFEDDVLLVWDDIHDIAPEQDNAIFRKTVTKLAAALPGDATLHVLAAARVERLETLSGNPRAEYGSDLWADFEVIELEPLAAEVLAGIFVRTLDHDELEVEASEEVREQFLRKALETDPSPLYVTSVVETAGERLTEADIEEIPDDALGIWTEEYEDIRRERTEWADARHRYVLLAFKILKEIGITPYHSLVKGVYDEVLGRDALELAPRLDELERRRWFVERETDEGAVLYEMHDVKAEAVDESVERQARDLSEFFRESLEWHLPRDVDGLERICHGQLALYLKSADVRRGPELAEKHHLEILGEAGIDPDDEVTHSNYGNLLSEELGSPEEAATHYERAIDINPQDAEAHYNYALLLNNELGRPEDAATQYERAIDINPQYAQAHYNYGLLLQEELGRPEKAATHYERAIDINPQYAQAHSNYGTLLGEELGRPEEAATHYERAIDINPQYAQAHYNYGNLLSEELGRPEEAATHYERAIDINPELAQAHSNYGTLLGEELGRPEEAATHYERAIDINPQYAQTHSNYGALLSEELGRPDEAATHYERAIDINPQYAQAHYNYGNLLSEELGRPEEAATHYERAIDINPQYADVHSNYGTLLKNELESPEEAATHYERAIEINPQDAKTHYNYATLLWPELDRPEEAREHLETSVGLWLERGIVGNALNDLRMLVVVCRALDDSAGTVENCDRAASLLDELDGNHSDNWRWFGTQKVLADDDAETPELYQMALLNVRASEPSQAVKLLSAAWNHRDEHAEETEELGAARAAGVALAVHAEMFDDGDIPPTDEILAELDPEHLHEPENVVYEQLTGGDPGTDGESLFSRGEEHREEGEKFAALEAEAFGILLGQLK